MQNILYGIVGLLLGLIVGFMFANSLNRSGVATATVPQAGSATTSANPALPPDHPPIGGDPNGSSPSGGAMPQVTEAIEKARSQPNDFEAQMTAADLYYQIQRFEEAAKYYEAASKLKPAELEPMVKAGNAHFDSEKFEIAEGWYNRALEKDPKDLSVRTDLGLTFFLRSPRDIERAIKEYKAVLAIDPKHELALQNLAIAYRESGDKENFRATLEQLKKANPSNPALKNLETSL